MQPLPARTTLLACLALLVAFASIANAAVLGIDFGTLHLKAALIKPGTPLDIVLTKDSKRKEVAALAFKPNRDESNNIIAEEGTFPERAYGGDALALQGRFPGEVFPNLKSLLGLGSSEYAASTVAAYNLRYPSLQVIQDSKLGNVSLKSSAFVDSELPYSVEELIGMELANIKRNAAAAAGSGTSVNDVVITVPAFYTADEKQAIIRAAELADLNVNALISDGLAVGLDYAKSRTFPEVTKGEKPEYHIVFDMGAGSTTATLLRFQSKSVKDVGRYNKTVQEVAVLGTGWDRTLGGDSLNDVIAKDFVYKFITKPVLKSRNIRSDDVRANGRLMARVYKESERVRQILSANTETTSTFEELLPGVDFKAKITRSEFETLTTSYASRVEGPIKDALAMAKLTIDDVSSMILHGGAVRTPFVQKKLEEIVGDVSKLRTNVNADESAVFGAAFKAAGLSPSFKVKEIRDSDVAAYKVNLEYTDKGKERKSPLFLPSSVVGNGGATKQVSFNDKEDFTFQFIQTIDDVDSVILLVNADNITASVQKLSSSFGCEVDQVNTKFNIRLSGLTGLPEIVSGSVSCEVAPKAESVGDTVKDWLGFGKKKDQASEGDAENDGPIDKVDAAASPVSDSHASGTASSSSLSSAKASEAPKKRTETVPLHWSSSIISGSKPSVQDTKRIQERSHAFDQSDTARIAREEALNGLEGYSYYVRDFLENEDFHAVSTEEQREAISKLLQGTREWMDKPGELSKASKETLKMKQEVLQKLVLPIQNRRKEIAGRPEKIKVFKESLEDAQKLVLLIQEQIDKAREAAQSLSSSSSQTKSSHSSTATPSSDDFASLEEEDATSATEAAAERSNIFDDSPYANVDITEITERLEAIITWLAEKEAEQSNLQPHENPVLVISEIERKATQLATISKDLVYEQMKAARSLPKKPKSSTRAKNSSKTKSKSSAASESTIDASPDPSTETIISETPSSQATSPTDVPTAGEEGDVDGAQDHDEL